MSRMKIVLFFAAVMAAPVAAQERSARTDDDGACEAYITHVFIDNHSIFDTTDPDLDQRLRWAYGLANSLHWRTRPHVIRRELLFGEGDCYDPQVLEDSERLLRALGFLGDVDVFGVPQSDGSYHVIVDTQDEWSTKAEVRLDLSGGLSVERFRLEESNLMGTGRRAQLFFADRSLSRSYGVYYATPQMMGTRWDLEAAGGSSRAGTFFEQALTYPFVGEIGRWAARQAFRRSDRLFEMVAARTPEGAGGIEPRDVHLFVPQREKSMEMSIVRRFGRRGGLSFMGGGVSFQELSYPGGRGASILVFGNDLADSVAAADTLLDPIWSGLQTVENVRAFVLLGHRSVYWIERSRLDALRAKQDVRLGAEIGLALGRSLPGLETADDLFTTLTFFGGTGLGDQGLLTTELRVDARRDFDAPVDGPEWEDIVAAGRLLSYWRFESLPDQTFVVQAAAAAGWHNHTPFQLTLGGEYGLRGYDARDLPGGRLVTVSVEDRLYLGWPWPDLFDAGLSFFADAGSMWQGDVASPWAADSGLRMSAGAGLRVNFPAGGRTTYRLDFAMPIGDGGGFGDVRVLLSIGELISLSRSPERTQVARSRLSGLSGDVFNFPR